jgi:copper transporter 1
MMSGLHTSGGDTLLFNSLRPTSPGALAGAALVLFAIAVLERWLAATRIVLDANWHKRCVVSHLFDRHSVDCVQCSGWRFD